MTGKGAEGSTSLAGADPSTDGKNHRSGFGLQLSSSSFSRVEQQTYVHVGEKAPHPKISLNCNKQKCNKDKL